MFGLDGAVDSIRIDESIDLLKQHMGTDESIKPLIAILEKVSDNPYNTALIDELAEVFNGLGVTRGAVLTFAPYIGTVLQDDPFEGEDPFEGIDPFDD